MKRHGLVLGAGSPTRRRWAASPPGNAHTRAIRVDKTIACRGHGPYVKTQPKGAITAVAASRETTLRDPCRWTIACGGLNNYGQTDAPP